MSLLFRNVAKTLFAAGVLAASAVVHAAAPASGDSTGSLAQANRNLLAPENFLLSATSETPRYQTEGVSSSTDAVEAEIASLSASPLEGAGSGAGQYGGRRRRSYGRSRYQDRWHNADGSNKVAIVAGAGLNVPVGNTGKFYTPSYTITGGAGWNFNRQFGVLAEFHYDHLGTTGGSINYEYNNLLASFPTITPDDLIGLDGNAHVLAITLNPVVNFSDRDRKLGAYITGGVGYYRKSTNFTLPALGRYCDYYGFCYTYTSNQNIDTASANAFGANGGFGLTYKLSEFSSERLFVEARYHWLKIDSTNNSDFFPFNRRNSEYVPVTVGIRF